jgi:hypothetical protein
MRDGPEGQVISSRVQVVDVGQDEGGKTLTTLVVVPSDPNAVDAGSKNWKRGTGVLYAAIRERIRAKGEAFQPEPGVLPVQAVDAELVRLRFYETYGETEPDEKKRQATLRQAFKRALADLQGRGAIVVFSPASGPFTGRTLIWMPSRGEDGL